MQSKNYKKTKKKSPLINAAQLSNNAYKNIWMEMNLPPNIYKETYLQVFETRTIERNPKT